MKWAGLSICWLILFCITWNNFAGHSSAGCVIYSTEDLNTDVRINKFPLSSSISSNISSNISLHTLSHKDLETVKIPSKKVFNGSILLQCTKSQNASFYYCWVTWHPQFYTAKYINYSFIIPLIVNDLMGLDSLTMVFCVTVSSLPNCCECRWLH